MSDTERAALARSMPNKKYTVATPEAKHKFLEALSKGVSRVAACNYAGISFSAMTRWFQEARAVLKKMEEDEEYLPTPTEELRLSWYMDTKETEALIEEKAVVHWKSFFDKDWKAAQAYLSVRFRKEWGPQQQKESPTEGLGGLLGGGVSVHVYLPENGRSAAALEDVTPEALELMAVPVTISDPPNEPVEEV